jgi:quinol-cytochrome oxidoreductase complex cytochrome b subunit
MLESGAASAVPAAQVIVAVIPIVGIVMGSVVVFFYLLWRHREIVRQIESGSYRRPVFDLHLFSLLAGFLLTGVGFALTVLFLCMEGMNYTLLGGLIPFSLGAGLLAFYFVTSPSRKKSGGDV